MLNEYNPIRRNSIYKNGKLISTAERILELFKPKSQHFESKYEWLEKRTEIVTILVEEFYPQ